MRNMNITQKAHTKLLDSEYAETSEYFRNDYKDNIIPEACAIKNQWGYFAGLSAIDFMGVHYYPFT